MGVMQKTAVIVPCYNEAKRLNRDVFLDFLKGDENLHFLFVNDGSRDATLDLLISLQKANPTQISYLNLEKNSGKAEAVRQGLMKTIELDYINIGYWDADLATPLYVINNFCRILDTSDSNLVIGSRVRLLGRAIRRRTSRHYLGRIFATFSSIILQIPIYDTQCGAKIFKKTDSLKKVLRQPFSVKWTFDVELLARISLFEKASGIMEPHRSWVEYPLEEWADVKGSKVGWKDFISGGFEFLKIFGLLYLPRIKDRYLASLID